MMCNSTRIMKGVSWMTLLNVLLLPHGCDSFLQTFRRSTHRRHHQHHQDSAAPHQPPSWENLLLVPPLWSVKKGGETSSYWVEAGFQNGTIGNELNELRDVIREHYTPRDDLTALQAANDKLQAENSFLKQVNKAYQAEFQRLRRELEYSRSIRVTDVPDFSYEGLVKDDPEYKDQAEAAEHAMRQQVAISKASFDTDLNRAKEQARKEQMQSTSDNMASKLQADIQTLRSKQDALLSGTSNSGTATSSLGTAQLERLKSLSQSSNELVEQYAQEVSALQQKPVSCFPPVGSRTAVPAAVALGLAAGGLAWSNAELIQNAVSQQDALALLVAQFREQNADLAVMIHQLIQTVEQLPEWTTASLQSVASEVDCLREATVQQMNQITTAATSTATVSNPYFVGPLPETMTGSNTFQSGVLWTWSEPLRAELERQHRDLVASLQRGPDVDIAAVKESIRRQYETTEMHWRAVGSEWNRQVLLVLDQVFAFLYQQLDLLQTKVDDSNQELLEKSEIAMQVGREKLEEYQQIASVKISTFDTQVFFADLQDRLETMLVEAESKLPTLQDAEEWKEFARGESDRLVQEFIFGDETLANAWAEAARMEADRLQQKLVLQIHDAKVYGSLFLESFQLHAETLRLQQQDSTAASIDAIRENIMDLIPLSQKHISNFKIPEISVEVKSFDIDGMKESVRGQWGKLLQSLSQVELPALPKLEAFGGLESVKILKDDISGLQILKKIPEMPEKIDFSVPIDAVKWPAFDVSAVKDTIQGIVTSASDKTASNDMGGGISSTFDDIKDAVHKQVQQAQHLKGFPTSVDIAPIEGVGTSADAPPLSLETTVSTPEEFGKQVLERLPDTAANIPATETIEGTENAVPSSMTNAKEQSDLLGILAEYNGNN